MVIHTTALALLDGEKPKTMTRHGLLSAKVSMSEERMIFALAAVEGSILARVNEPANLYL